MSRSQHTARLALVLAHDVAQLGWTPEQVSRELGRAETYLGACLSGERELKLLDVLRVLSVFHIDFGEFFEQAFPLAGPTAAFYLDRLPKEELDPLGIEPMRRALKQRQGVLPPTPAELERRAARQLKAQVRSVGLTLEQAGARLEREPTALARELRRPGRLRCETLFEALHLIGLSPARFFYQLTQPEEVEQGEDPQQREALDLMEKSLEELWASPKVRQHFDQRMRDLGRLPTKDPKSDS